MHNPLGLGKSSAFGERGITKRLGALARWADLHGDRLLDIGCGDGAYTIRLADGFNRVDAIDIQADRLALFTEQIKGSAAADRITVSEMSATQLDYPDRTFDLVTSIEVLEHIEELDQALEEIQRVLKPDGRFAFTTPNRWFPFETHGFIYRGRRYPPARAPFLTWVGPLHRRLADARTFTAAELRQRLATAGFRTCSVDYIMPPFDRSRVGQRIRPITNLAERTPLRRFGMALVVTAEKPR
jgi:ubiquinone/menaquinone biosynthesis C-methylase UbiE